jgi:hypothetical protein
VNGVFINGRIGDESRRSVCYQKESRSNLFQQRVSRKDNEREAFLKVNDEIVLRRTSSGRQEIKAFFLVDNRKTARLTLQRFSTDREQPRKEAYFTLQGDEIAKLFELLLIIRTAKFDAQDKVRLDSKDLHQFSLTPKAIRTLLT